MTTVANAEGGRGAAPPGLTRRWSEPTAYVLALVIGLVVIWGAGSALFHSAPQDDSLEQVLLSQELRSAYGKHPPLPTWMLYAANRVFGPSIGTTFVLSALCSAATLLLLYGWARPLVGAQRAALATLLASAVPFQTAATTYFNHNSVQLPLALLTVALFHRALTRMRVLDWALLGAGAALMMLAKFSAVVLFTVFVVYLVWTRRLFTLPVMRGGAIALLVGAALLAPHLWASFDAATTPGSYASGALYPQQFDRLERLKSVWTFASSHLAKLAPAFLIFLLLRRYAPSAPDRPHEAVALGPFLTIVGFGPLLLTLVVAALAGAYLLVAWGTTFHVLFTLWLVAARPFAIDATPRLLRLAFAACFALQAVLWVGMTANNGTLPSLNRAKPARSVPPGAQLADAVREQWQRHSPAPLRYAIADRRTGAGLAVQFRGTPLVLDANRGDFDAIVPAQVLEACGAVIVVPGRLPASPAPGAGRLVALAHEAQATSVVKWIEASGATRTFTLGIRTPAPGAVCTGPR